MNLRFALLAALSAKPRTGYDLIAVFDRSVGNVWHAEHPQIYPELRRMESDGLIVAREVPRGPNSTKREYRLTDDGLAELRLQASTPVEPGHERDPYRLKAAYLEYADPKGAQDQFRLHLEHFTKLADHYEQILVTLHEGTDSVLNERLELMPPEQHERIVASRILSYEGLLARAEMELKWARKGLKVLDELAQSELDATDGVVDLSGADDQGRQ
jgi:DNA-binding PadR family transcriptional regulator